MVHEMVSVLSKCGTQLNGSVETKIYDVGCHALTLVDWLGGLACSIFSAVHYKLCTLLSVSVSTNVLIIQT